VSLKHVSRMLAFTVAVSLGFYLLWVNLTPLGAVKHYDIHSKLLTALGPKSRVHLEGAVMRQVSDLAYFTATLPYTFTHANLAFLLHNPTPNQEVRVGFQDQPGWHYNTQIIDSPMMDALAWPKVGSGPYLYQKKPTYTSTQDFISKPPTDKLLGVYAYDPGALKQTSVQVSDYQPATANTEIDVPLRGRITMYAYLDNEPFQMSLEKHDLNWYGDPDPVEVRVYKDSNLVFDTTIADDGDSQASHHTGPLQFAEIKNPGPGLPSPGVYKIVIDASTDSVITKISTNLHKLVFEGPLYPVSNHDVYGSLIPKTVPTNLYTNGFALTAQMFHDQPQTLLVGDRKLPLIKASDPVSIDTDSQNTMVQIPKSDVVINGVGYFAFSQDQFFEPTPYHIMQITGPKDLERVDYVLTSYQPPQQLGDGWVKVNRDFDLKNAVAPKGRLSWVVSAPGLTDNQRFIDIKDIELTLSKKGWFR